MPQKSNPQKMASRKKKIVVYARVSTQEQTKGHFPSCDSQIEEGEAYCNAKGWSVYERIKDEGQRAGTLQRPGLARIRHLIETRQIDGVVCTWYNRLVGTQDFHILNKEFKANNVDLVTIHDPTDRNTAAGRMQEAMLVTFKTFENEQIAEKVRTKMRMRREKGMGNGGHIPFGFLADPTTHLLRPDPEKAEIVKQLFEVYVRSGSDCAVRDWLKAHQIPTAKGKPVWTQSSIRDLLLNRRYIGQIEINKKHKDILDLPEAEQYKILPTPHAPLIPTELFEQALRIRTEKAQDSPNRRGRPRSSSQNQCQRVFVLQGCLKCAVCGHAMTPTYVHHKPGYQRRTDSYIFHYICAQQQMNGTVASGHSNRILARRAEEWIQDAIQALSTSPEIMERALEMARLKGESDYQPQREALALVKSALRENDRQLEEIVSTISSGKAHGALMNILNEKAESLSIEREGLRLEQKRLTEALAPLNHHFDAGEWKNLLTDFSRLAARAEPEELQRLIRLLVKEIVWVPKQEENKAHHVEFFLPASRPDTRSSLENWFESKGWLSGPDRWIVEPVFLELGLEDDSVFHLSSAIFNSEFTEEQANPPHLSMARVTPPNNQIHSVNFGSKGVS